MEQLPAQGTACLIDQLTLANNMHESHTHELIEKIVVNAPDKSSGHRTQQIEIYYRFDVAVSAATADSMKYSRRYTVSYSFVQYALH